MGDEFRAELERRDKAWQERLEKLESGVTAKVEDLDPEYVARKEGKAFGGIQ